MEDKKMALRTIRVQGDPVLEKICKPVKELTPRTKELIEDMLDTMYEANGVGLAAPQVGILKRIVVIDVGEGPVVMVNPVILETSGEQTGDEGCLSIPGKAGQVTRPNYVKVHAFDENMEEIRKVQQFIIPTKNLRFFENIPFRVHDNVMIDFKTFDEENTFNFAFTMVQVPYCIFITTVWGNTDTMKQYQLGKAIKSYRSILPKNITKCFT